MNHEHSAAYFLGRRYDSANSLSYQPFRVNASATDALCSGHPPLCVARRSGLRNLVRPDRITPIRKSLAHDGQPHRTGLIGHDGGDGAALVGAAGVRAVLIVVGGVATEEDREPSALCAGISGAVTE